MSSTIGIQKENWYMIVSGGIKKELEVSRFEFSSDDEDFDDEDFNKYVDRMLRDQRNEAEQQWMQCIVFPESQLEILQLILKDQVSKLNKT